MEVFIDRDIRDAQRAPALRSQIGVTTPVVRDFILSPVRFAVHFDNQLAGVDRKIRDVGTDRMLETEVVANPLRSRRWTQRMTSAFVIFRRNALAFARAFSSPFRKSPPSVSPLRGDPPPPQAGEDNSVRTLDSLSR